MSGYNVINLDFIFGFVIFKSIFLPHLCKVFLHQPLLPDRSRLSNELACLFSNSENLLFDKYLQMMQIQINVEWKTISFPCPRNVNSLRKVNGLSKVCKEKCKHFKEILSKSIFGQLCYPQHWTKLILPSVAHKFLHLLLLLLTVEGNL